MSTVINGTTGIDKVQDGIITDNKLTLVPNSSPIKTTLNADGNSPIFACRAWVNFNGTGTVAIRDSGNVSSITDNGTGAWTVNFIEGFDSASYSAVVGSGRSDNAASQLAIPSTYFGTNSYRIHSLGTGGGNFLRYPNSKYCCFQIGGKHNETNNF